ncbi:CPBP family intramembrane metalloprotease [Proteobacteria bacterium 005FR1]|nr:CPBP family intramembrane metalloprotease [Proteobacteria bacterium 005FR1]
MKSMSAIDGNASLNRPIRLLLTAALILSAIITPIPFPFKVPTFALLALAWVWMEHRSLAPVGLQLSLRPRTTLLWTSVAVLVVVVVLGYVINPLIEWIFSRDTDLSGYGALQGNAEAALRLWLYAVLSAAIGEEIVYRGFLLHQLSLVVPKGRAGEWIAIGIGALAFALPHYFQGIVGLITVALVGIVLGWIFFRSGRNLWSLILAHALIDAWGIYTLYRGW